MATIQRVTPHLFEQLSATLEYADPLTVAIQYHISNKTVLQIKASKDYAEYRELQLSQHPKSTKPPIATRLDAIEFKLDQVLEYAKSNRLL